MTYKWLQRPFEFLEECANRYGDVFTIRIAGFDTPLVMFSNPEEVRRIFADDGETMLGGKMNVALRPFLGESSLLLLDKKDHQRQRRLLMPPFHGERMQAYGQAMLDLTHDEIDAWPLRTPFAIHPHLQAITLRLILRTVFGFEAGPRMTRLSKLLAEILEIAAWAPLLIPFMQKDLGPLSPWGRYVRKSREGDALLLEEIAKRRLLPLEGRTDVLSMLLLAKDEEGQPMTDGELRDELVTLLVAGHETTATALAWSLRWVLDSPDILLRLKEEVANVPMVPERIAKLELLDAVTRETLRLQPVIPLVGRVLEKPVTLAGFDLPAGVGVLCSIYLAQRRAAMYPNPQLFDPDRFLRKKFSPNEFFPFGGGVRKCIGMTFALYEMKMVLAAIVSRASLRLAGRRPIRVVRRSITLAPSEGLIVSLDARKPRTHVSGAGSGLGKNDRSISA